MVGEVGETRELSPDTGDLEFPAGPTTEIVLLGVWRAQIEWLDPKGRAQAAEAVAKAQRIQAGELTVEEAFGPDVDFEGLIAHAERRSLELTGRQIPRLYRLPGHLHWMGDGISNNYYRPEEQRYRDSVT